MGVMSCEVAYRKVGRVVGWSTGAASRGRNGLAKVNARHTSPLCTVPLAALSFPVKCKFRHCVGIEIMGQPHSLKLPLVAAPNNAPLVVGVSGTPSSSFRVGDAHNTSLTFRPRCQARPLRVVAGRALAWLGHPSTAPDSRLPIRFCQFV